MLTYVFNFCYYTAVRFYNRFDENKHRNRMSIGKYMHPNFIIIENFDICFFTNEFIMF
jgi:hypothetical protein